MRRPARASSPVRVGLFAFLISVYVVPPIEEAKVTALPLADLANLANLPAAAPAGSGLESDAERDDEERDLERRSDLVGEADAESPEYPFPGGLLPAEFARQEAIVIDGVDLPRTWTETFLELVGELRSRVRIIALTGGREDRAEIAELLEENGLPRDTVLVAEVAHDTMWVRDFGPVAVKRIDGRDALVDLGYAGLERPSDDGVPGRLGALLGLPVHGVPLEIDGGNLLVNGEGLCLTTTVVFERNDTGEGQDVICGALLTYFGCEQVVFLEPLEGEETGHADMFAVFTSPSTVVVGEYAPEVDPLNGALLERNAELLAAVETRRGPLRVRRVPMPARRDGVWRTWTNVVFANGALLFPSYNDVDAEDQKRALSTFGEVLPAWEIIEIDSEALATLGGALHCVTMNMAAAGDTAKLVAGEEDE